MKKHDFIDWLRNRLSDVPREELDRICGFYANAIDERTEDGMTEEEAVHALGEPESLLREIRSSLPLKYREEPQFGASPQRGESFGTWDEPERKTPRKKLGGGWILLIVICVIAALSAAVMVPFGLLRSVGPVWSSPEPVYAEALPATPIEEPAYSLDRLGDITHITVTQQVGQLYICPSGDAHMEARLSGYAHLDNQVSEDALTLEVVQDDRLNNDVMLDLMLPNGSYVLDVEMDAGTVNLYGVIVSDLNVTVAAGDLYLGDLAAKESVTAKVNVGDMWASAVTAKGKVDLSVDTGDMDVTLAGFPADYAVDAKVELGRCDLPEDVDPNGTLPVTLRVDIGNLNLCYTYSED